MRHQWRVTSTNKKQTASFFSIKEPLVTSDYVVDETLTLFRSRGESRRVLKFGQQVIDGGFDKIVTISEADFAEAWQIF